MTPEEITKYVDAAIKNSQGFTLFYIILASAITLALSHLTSYLKAKGKNLATKEDITEVTDKIESTKTVYLEKVEKLRYELSSKSQYSRLRFEKELEILRLIWPTLHELKEKVLSLRPVMDAGLNEGETMESRKRERAEAYLGAFRAFSLAVEHNRPFYSHEIWQGLKELKDICWSEAVDWRFHDGSGLDYWDKAMENQKKISEKIDSLADLIRKRLSEFE